MQFQYEFIMKKLLILLLSILISNTSSASVSLNWFDYAISYFGEDGRNALEVITEEGLILSRVKPDYAAFTLGAERLSEEDRKSSPIDVSEFDVVIEFETCNATTELLSGTIYLARVRYRPFDIDDFMYEFLGIQKDNYDLFKNSGEIQEASEVRYIVSYPGLTPLNREWRFQT